MIAAFATLLFGVTFWLVFVLAVRTFEESGAKIVRALRPEQPRSSGAA